MKNDKLSWRKRHIIAADSLRAFKMQFTIPKLSSIIILINRCNNK